MRGRRLRDGSSTAAFAGIFEKTAGRLPFCGHLYFRIVPVNPSGEHLNGSIFRSEGKYSVAARGNGCLKNSGSAISTSTTSRCLAVST